MSIFDDIRKKGASYVLTDDALHAEAVRELKSNTRLAVLWATAMADSDMDERKAATRYVRLRVKSLKEEATKLVAEQQRAAAQAQRRQELRLFAQRQQKQAKQQAQLHSKPLHQRIGAVWVAICGMVLLSLAFFMVVIRH
jgi:hypothetical protein